MLSSTIGSIVGEDKGSGHVRILTNMGERILIESHHAKGIKINTRVVIHKWGEKVLGVETVGQWLKSFKEESEMLYGK